MKFLKPLLYISLSGALFSCGEKETPITLNFQKEAKTFQLGEVLSFESNKGNSNPIDSISYEFQGKKETVTTNKVALPLTNVLLGKHILKTTIFSGKDVQILSTEITILNSKAPQILNYKIVNTYPHQTTDYTQGLEFKGDQLFESAGQRGESRLSEKELETGKTLKTHTLDKQFFAEGLTIVGDKIHQLTWQGDIGFTYNLSDFKQLGTFAYNNSKEGWGLCYDGKNTIYKSDGTTKIWKLNAQTLKEEGFIQITTNKALKSKFNELEWIDGKIYANTWQKDSIAIINPENGAIEAIINLNGIRKEVNVSPKDRDKVLNGIAYKKNTKQLYITGKYWPKLFEIEVVN